MRYSRIFQNTRKSENDLRQSKQLAANRSSSFLSKAVVPELIRGLALTFTVCGSIYLVSAQSLDTYPESIFVNGKIYTVDNERSWVEAMAVTGGVISAVGLSEDIASMAGSNTRVIELEGKMVMPGIHDAHTHLLHAGLKWTHECRLPPNAGSDVILERLRACASEKEHDGWIVAGDYNPNIPSNENLDRKFLDQVFPDIAVYIYDFTIHHALVNTKALVLAGIDSSTVDPVGGRIVKDKVTNEPTGELIEMATVLVSRVIPPYSAKVQRDALSYSIARCHQFGITSIQEASGTRDLLKLYHEFDANEKLNLTVMAHIVWGSEKWGGDTVARLDDLIKSRDKFASHHVATNATKVWMDGAPLPPHFTEVGLQISNGEVQRDKLLFNQQQLEAKLTEWAQEGVKPKIHVAGAGSVRVALNAIENAYRGLAKDVPRPDLAHSNLISKSDIKRYAELGVVAEMSPAIWHYGDVEGLEMVNNWWPFASLLTAGANVTIASDWILPPTPNLFPALAGVITRSKESVGLADAIEMMTRNGAISVGKFDRFGSLEVGKSATFIVLDRNLFTIKPSEIGATDVLLTVFEGEPVYSSSHFSFQ